MNSFLKRIIQFLADDRGPTAVGYAMIILLVALAGLSAAVFLGQLTGTRF